MQPIYSTSSDLYFYSPKNYFLEPEQLKQLFPFLNYVLYKTYPSFSWAFQSTFCVVNAEKTGALYLNVQEGQRMLQQIHNLFKKNISEKLATRKIGEREIATDQILNFYLDYRCIRVSHTRLHDKDNFEEILNRLDYLYPEVKQNFNTIDYYFYL